MKKLLCSGPFYLVDPKIELKNVEIKVFQRDENKLIDENDIKKLRKLIDEFQPDAIFSTIVETRQFFPFNKEFFDTCPKNLKMIQQSTAGFNNIDIESAEKKNVLVYNSPKMNSDETAEMAVLLMLTTMRKIKQNINYMRHGNWKMKEFLGKTLGIVGLGGIGISVVERARPFKMNIIYFDVYKKDAKEEEKLGISYRKLDDLLKEADIITLHCPLNKHTKHMIGKTQFKMMKKTAILINTSRGPVVNEDELIDALKNGDIAGAGMDVQYEEPCPLKRIKELWNLSVTCTPHIGGLTVECLTKMEKYSLKNLKSFLVDGKAPEKPIKPRKKK